MTSDSNGQELRVGDVVTIRFRVVSLAPGNGCRVAPVDLPYPPGVDVSGDQVTRLGGDGPERQHERELRGAGK